MLERAAIFNKVMAANTGKVVDIWRLFGDMTLEVVGTTAFG